MDLLSQFNPEHIGFMQHNGVWLDDSGSYPPAVLVDVQEYSKNPYGIVHGGLYFTMMDIAAYLVAHEDGRNYVTQGGNIHFYRSATHGRLSATASLAHRGHTVCTMNTEIRDEEGTLLADGSFTMFFVEI